jgi:hypothetical protein
METRGWVAFGAAVLGDLRRRDLGLGRLSLCNGPADPATAQFAGKLNAAFGMIVTAEYLNGQRLDHGPFAEA